MAEDILALPPELGYQIYKYCYLSDLINFACCSQEHYESVKYLLYNNIHIPWESEETQSFQTGVLENLKFTNALHFSDHRLDNAFNKVTWDSLSEWYEQILSYTDPNILVTLKIECVIINEDIAMKSLLLNNLQEIKLKNCYGIGVPGWLHVGSLRSLNRLTINECSIDDFGVVSIINASSLRELTLIKCHKVTEESLLYLVGLVHLHRLSIINCQNISSDGYIYLGEIINLGELVLLDGHITDSAMTSFTKFKYLRVLKINCSLGNPFDAGDTGLSYISELSSLEELCINWKYVTDNGFSHLASLPTLKHLNIDGCTDVGDAGLYHISKLTTLTHLNVSNCGGLTDAGVSHIKKLISLKLLDVSGCVLLTNKAVEHITNLSLLEKLYLCHCNKITDSSIVHLALLTSLKYLDVTECYQLTDDCLFNITVLEFLEGLRIRGCTNVTDVGLSHLCKTKCLRDLDMSLDLYSGQGICMHVDDVGLKHISMIQSIHRLNVSSCDYISDAGLLEIGKLELLCYLNVSCCIKISDVGLSHLSCLKLLRELDFSICPNVSDEGVEYACKLVSIKKLDLHGCPKVTHGWASLYPHISFKFWVYK